MKIDPYLNFAGNAEAAFNFYKSVFGGDFSGMFRFKDVPMEGVTIPKEEEDNMMHISIKAGMTDLMASDVLPSQGRKLIVGNNVYLSVLPDSKEEADRIFNALSEGGEVEMPMADQAWGDYFGSCKDKFGVCWMVNYGRTRT